MYFEALNVTNDTLSTHGRFDNQLLDVFAYWPPICDWSAHPDVV